MAARRREDGPAVNLLLPAILLLGVTAFVVWLLRRGIVAERRRLEGWRAFARDRGWRWVDASGPWYRRQACAIESTVEGVDVRIDTYTVSTGKSAVIYTRATAKLQRRVHVALEASWRNLFTLIAEKLGRTSISTDGGEFDRMMYVRAGSQEFARTVLDAEFRTRFLAIGRQPTIKIEGDLARITWHPAERDPAALEAGARAVAALARACARV